MYKAKQNIIIDANNIQDLIIPPTQDLFSPYEYIKAGESALTYTIQYIDPNKYKDITHIEIQLPHTKAKSTDIEEAKHIIQNFFKFHIKENNKKLIVFKRNTTRIFRNAILFLTLCMGIVAVLGMESFLPNLPPLMRSVLVEGFTVIGWVVMWRPIELLLNQWTTLKIENNLYQKCLNSSIKVSFKR